MIRIVERRDLDRAAWNAYVDRHEGGWWWHRAEWVDYLAAHQAGNRDESFAAVDDAGAIVGLGVLVLQEDGRSAQNSPLPLPLSTGPEPCHTVYTALAHKLTGLDRRGLTFAACPLVPVPPVGRPAREGGAMQSPVLDLTPRLDQLRQALRESYRALLHRGLCLLEMRMPLRLDRYRQAHRRAAGYPTRPDATWDMMGRWVYHDHLLNVIARDEDAQIMGGALFLVYKQRAYYASAAYLDEAPDGTAQAVLWTAIRELKAQGVLALELGASGHPPIAFFKQGFGAHPVAVRTWTF